MAPFPTSHRRCQAWIQLHAVQIASIPSESLWTLNPILYKQLPADNQRPDELSTDNGRMTKLYIAGVKYRKWRFALCTKHTDCCASVGFSCAAGAEPCPPSWRSKCYPSTFGRDNEWKSREICCWYLAQDETSQCCCRSVPRRLVDSCRVVVGHAHESVAVFL